MSALVLAAAVATLVASARIGLLGADARAARLWVPVGLVGLYAAAGLVIAVALMIMPARSGFVAGHAAVTVSWTTIALVLLARGRSNPQIATELTVTVNTVKWYLKNIYAKLGVSSRAEAVSVARRGKLL